jgi:ABC-type branched-subunit amino acid transport system substrate-binding protein
MRLCLSVLLVFAGCASARASADRSQGLAPVRSSTAIDAGDQPGGDADFRLIAARASSPYDPATRASLADFLARHPHHHSRPAAVSMLAGVLLLQDDAQAAKRLLEENDAFLTNAERELWGGICAGKLRDAERAMTLLGKYVAADPPLRVAGLPDHDVRRLLRATLADSLAALRRPGDAIDQLELYAQIESDRPSERIFALRHAEEIAANVPEPAAVDALRGRRGLFARATLGSKAVAALKARGDAANAARLEQDTLAVRRQVGLEAPLPSAMPADPSRLGMAVPLSGNQSRLGEVILRGAALAVSATAHAVEQSGFRIMLRDAAAPAERSTLGGGPAAAIVALAREERVIGAVSIPDARGGEFAAREGLPLVLLDERAGPGQATAFSLIHSAEARAVALARTALELGARRFVILHPSTSAGKRLTSAFRQAVEQGGGTVTGVVSYPPNTTTFVNEVTELRRAPFEALFVPDDAARLELIAPALAVSDIWPRSPRSVFSSARSAATSGPGRRESFLLSTALGVSERFLRSVGRYVQGALLCPGFYPSEDSRSASFVSRFRRAYATAPTATDAYGFDALYLLRGAVERGAKTRADVLRILSTQTFEGLTGDIRFRRDRGRADPPLVYFVDGAAVRSLR